MKKILSVLYFCFLINLVSAKSVDEFTARKTAENFYQLISRGNLKSGLVLTLAYKRTPAQSVNLKSGNTVVYYYVFNDANRGFIIIAGDDAAHPILGYSTEKSFDASNIPSNVAKWLENYQEQIRFLIENNIVQHDLIKTEWNNIISGQPLLKSGEVGVNPLLKTKWDQAPYYNALCPYDSLYKEKVLTGCVATAMAQIMKFWNYPKQGYGFHSYNHPKYGTLAANFGLPNYEWSNMPDTLNADDKEIARLMFHCGVAVEMDYHVEEEGGSDAHVLDYGLGQNRSAEFALKEYFNYSAILQGVSRSDYYDNDWKMMLKSDLDLGRPILYDGAGSLGGHAFVCDGYDKNDYFHMNWGWGGWYDGYFMIDALVPSADLPDYSFNDYQEALIGILPNGNQSNKIELYKDVTADKSMISYGEDLTILTDIKNSGTIPFNGDFGAAVFDEKDVLVDFLEIKPNMSLAAGSHFANGIQFSTSGISAMMPGKYTVYIFYNPAGVGQWIALKPTSGDITTKDFTTIEVVNKNDICLNASLLLTPGSNIYNNQTFSVKVDMINNSAKTFTGAVKASLFSLAGDSITTLGVKTGLTLVVNDHFINGLVFASANFDVPAGTYLLAVYHKWDGSAWELTGSSRLNGSSPIYLNPIKIIVQNKPLQPDIYENDDQVGKAFDLTTPLTSQSLVRKTTGSNFHIGTDRDYYKFSLIAGYDYTLNARIQDAGNSNDGKIYTADAVFSWSLDGITWSKSFNDVMPSEILVSGAKTIYFVVSPYNDGDTGTYELDLSISRTSSDLAKVTTTAISVITASSAASGGTIVSSGSSSISAKGVCWNIVPNPTTANFKTSNGTGSGSFVGALTNLAGGTTYYVRAYATNGSGTAYGNELSFTTTSLLPVLSTSTITAVTPTTAGSGGNISSSGGSSVTTRGVCWSTTSGATISDFKTVNGTGTGIFSSVLSGLTPGATYFVRAYATNSNGTAYGNELSFSTSSLLPTLTTMSASLVSTTTASSGGNISASGGSSVIARGVCWSTIANPTTANSKTNDGTGSGLFLSSLTSLNQSATYHVRAYATNSSGTAYGNEIIFTTASLLPTLETSPITSITSTSANCGGNISSSGTSSIIVRGICWNTSPNPVTSNNKTSNGTGSGNFIGTITGLIPGTTYYVRAYATNSSGTAYGNEVSFTSSSVLSTLTTSAISAVTTVAATGGGNISSNGGALITSRGVCWSSAHNPTKADNRTNDGTGSGPFTSSITNLAPGTIYYVRAYATNSVGTAYGNEVSFTAEPVLSTLTTSAISTATSATATCGGNISSSGGASVTARGVCWSTNTSPTTADNKTTDGTGTGNFVSTLTGLSAGITYYVRAYATNSAGTAYGSVISFSSLVTSISDFQYSKDSIIVYPNPASVYTNIDLQNFQHKIIKINIIDTSGRLVFSENLSDSKLIRIPTANFLSGTFFINLFGETSLLISRKLIVIN